MQLLFDGRDVVHVGVAKDDEVISIEGDAGNRVPGSEPVKQTSLSRPLDQGI